MFGTPQEYTDVQSLVKCPDHIDIVTNTACSLLLSNTWPQVLKYAQCAVHMPNTCDSTFVVYNVHYRSQVKAAAIK